MPRKIVVTGGGGYIGIPTCKELVRKGCNVTVIDKFYFGIDYLEKELPGMVEIVIADLRAPDTWREALSGADAVIHLAGLSNDPSAAYNPEANDQINRVATKYLVDECVKAGVRRFTNASTCSVYGIMPLGLRVDEDYDVAPQSVYAKSNLAAEKIIIDKMRETPEFDAIIFRQATVMGWSPRMRFDLVVNAMTLSAWKDGVIKVFAGGEAYRPLIHVDDVAKAHVAAALIDELPCPRVLNISHKNYQMTSLAHWIKHVLRDRVDCKVDVSFNSKEHRSYSVDTSRFESAFGQKCELGVSDAVNSVWEKLENGVNADWWNPIYRNIDWLEHLKAIERLLDASGGVGL